MKYFLYHPVQYSTPSQPSIKNVLLSFCSRLRDEKTTIFVLLAQKLPYPVEFKFDRCMLHPCNEVISKQTPNSVFLANFRHLDGQEKKEEERKRKGKCRRKQGMVPRVARSGSSSTLFGKTKSNEGEKPSGRRKGVVSCPPIPRPISDKRDKREKKRIFPKVYIFRFFRASRRSRPSPSFLLILSKKFMKEIPGNITFLSQIDRSR